MRKLLWAVVLGAASTTASALEVEKSVMIEKAPADVWAVLGDFCAIADWHPVIASCVLEARDDGTYRLLTTGDGGALLEKQLGHDDGVLTYQYAIVESPLPVVDYVSTIKVEADGDGSMVTWMSNFNAAEGASDDDASGVIGGIYDTGLAELKAQVEGN